MDLLSWCVLLPRKCHFIAVYMSAMLPSTQCRHRLFEKIPKRELDFWFSSRLFDSTIVLRLRTTLHGVWGRDVFIGPPKEGNVWRIHCLRTFVLSRNVFSLIYLRPARNDYLDPSKLLQPAQLLYYTINCSISPQSQQSKT